ncbi:MAG TPA: serine/threonine-protein kinase [Candidatus Polarisedimenticolia bacterium]
MAELFAEALERPPEERRAFLDSRCSGSADLRAEIDSLIAAHEARERAGTFLGQIDRERSAVLLQEEPELEAAGRRVGPYRLLRELGRGGMGVVYLAERAEGGFQQNVAIKLLKRGMDSDAILKRFLRERQILAGLEHLNVARLLDGGVTDEGQPWFAMEHVDGVPITEYCRERQLDLRQRLRLFEESCRAVQYAHGKLIVHRDLKPSNMLVTAEGQLKLLDFGVAKLLGGPLAGDERSVTLTQTGIHPLTPEYAAPEQVRGEPVTTATDIYALGLVLYELLTGRRPYGGEGSSRQDLARAACETEPPPPSEASDVPPRAARSLKGDLDAVVLKALRKEPQRRYASAEALARDIGRFLAGQPVEARPDSVAYRAGRFVGRHKVGVGAVTAAALSLLAGLIGTSWQAVVAARERDRARLEAERAERVKEFLIDLFRASDPAESKGREVTAKELLERGTERIEKELSSQPAVQAELLYTMGVSFWSLGRLDRARTVEERSIEIARQAYGPEHPEVALGLDALGGILYASGQLEAAEETRRQALAMRRRLFPADSPEVAESMANLGTVLVRRAKLDEAEPLLREALEIRQKRLGPEHPDTARSIMNLANVVQAKGDYASAARLHAQAVSLRRKLRGDQHPEVATALGSLGAALAATGDLQGAEAAHREALSIRRKVLGAEHPAVALNMLHLASVLHLEGDLEGAESMYREALALDRKLLGESHSDVAIALTNLARLLTDRARFEEAMPLFDQAVALHSRVTGADHPFLATTLENKAHALIVQGRSREALPLLERCLVIFRARYGPAHPQTASALEDVAEARADLGELAEAEGVFREALDLQRRARQEPHRDTVVTLLGLGQVLVRQGRAAEAEPPLREALDQSEKVLPSTHWRQGDIQSVLGDCLRRLGKIDEARSLLRSGHDRLRESLGDTHPVTARARRRLAELP